VEFQFPYDDAPAEIAGRLRDNGLQLVLHNLPAGDWAKSERGIACHPGRGEEFRAGVARAIDYALALGCPRVNCLAGILPTGVEPALARATLIDNLAFAGEQLQQAGIGLALEAINTRDVPGFFVNSSAQALDLIEAAGSDNLKLQYDIYHMQIMEGDIARAIEANLPMIGHIQIADNPGRNEPGTGELNYPFLFAHLDRIGYAGWVGCEYRPATTTQAGLGWLSAAGGA
jgi:hydroxypyruvate isomerase